MPNLPPLNRPSSLPQLIPPQTAIFGTVADDSGKMTGKVLIDVNWWLFLYNIWKQTLSAPGTPVPISPVDTIALVDGQDISNTDAIQSYRAIANALALEAQDIELARADVAGLQRQIVNAQALQVETDPDVPGLPLRITNLQALLPDLDVTPSLRDMSNALALALDSLPQYLVAQAQPAQTVSVGGSPFTYTAPANGVLSVTAGTTSLISIIRQTVTVATGITAGLVPVSRTDQVQITFGGAAPTVVFLPT